MKAILVRIGFGVASLMIGLSAYATPVFFIEPNNFPAVDGSLDLAFQTAVGGVVEDDLDSFGSSSLVDAFALGGVNIDVGLSDDGVTDVRDRAEVFFGIYGAGGGTYGTVSGGAFLNRDTSVHDYITFDFDSSVAGFGAWLFDDGGENSTFTLTIFESDGSVTTSTVLDGGNGNSFFVEGFVGVQSDVGIDRIAIRTLDASNGGFFELDHIQIAAGGVAVPAPNTIALLGLMLGILFARKRSGMQTV